MMGLTQLLLVLKIVINISNGKELFPFLMPHVYPQYEESYLCTPIRIEDGKSHFITGFKPNATMNTAHHMLIFGCEEPGSSDNVWNCGEMGAKRGSNLRHYQPCSSSPQIIYAWAMDAPKLDLPKDVGFKVGKGSNIQFLVLQVHYASLKGISENGDDSGVFLEFSETYQPKQAGILLLGTGGFAPAHTTTYFETSCEINDYREFHPFAFRTHTHALGKVVSGWKVNPRTHQWTLIGKQDPQKPQMFYPTLGDNVTFTGGDTIAARCTMVNYRDQTTYIGTTKEDEMCNFYIMYWVEGDDGPLKESQCFSPGPPSWSWDGYIMGPGLKNIPDVEASTLN